MARTWSMELARDNITANAVIPTAMTAMTATIPIYKDWAEQFEQGQELPPLARQEHALGSPEDVAPLLEWLISDASANVTGQAIGIGGDRLTLYSHPTELVNEIHDGGWSASGINAAWSQSMAAQAQPSGPFHPAPETKLPDKPRNPGVICVKHAELWKLIAAAVPERTQSSLATNASAIKNLRTKQHASPLYCGIGVGAGDTIAFYMYNRAEYLTAFYGALKIGAAGIHQFQIPRVKSRTVG